MNRKYELATLGCKVNQYESQQLRELLHAYGWVPADAGETPDLAIVNSCAVTSEASRKSRQAARRSHRQGRTAVVVVGCDATADADRLANLPGVSAVWGHDTDVADKLARFLTSLGSPTNASTAKKPPRITNGQEGTETSRWQEETSSRPQAGTTNFSTPGGRVRSIRSPISSIGPLSAPVKQDVKFSIPIGEFDGRQRAFVKIQDGCDAHCTYCIIPALRTQVLSKTVQQTVDEVAGLVENGYREVVLTGIFLGAYGRETALRRRWNGARQPIAELVDAVARVPGLKRLRLSSLEPGDATDELLDVMRRHPACVPHLHLPLQSGSTEILRKMNRQYTRAEFDQMITRVHDAFDRPAVTTDIIVGFPGETDDDFAGTIAAARNAGFCKIHAFPFSPRPGTAAARWSRRFINGNVVRDRMAALRALEREMSLAYRAQFIGEPQRVLVESCTPAQTETHSLNIIGQDGAPYLAAGRTDRYFEVHFDADRDLTRELAPVVITRVTPSRTHGVVL